eukprot:510983-Heterocapsa_arctica.AAC.1
MAGWFVDHHKLAERLGLLRWDLSRNEVIPILVNNIKRYVSDGHDVFIWIALPCTPWTSWQHINMRGRLTTHRNILAARAESRAMLRILIDILEQTLGNLHNGHV